MNIERDRVISISLTEAEWQAFVARRPKPVDWCARGSSTRSRPRAATMRRRHGSR